MHVLFEEPRFTTDDAAAYYEAIAPVLLPYVRNRPLSFRRFPTTVDGASFWEKDAPAFTPDWIRTVQVARREGSPLRYIVASSARTLRWLASVGGIELHPFLHTIRSGAPASIIFDLDPGKDTTMGGVAEVATLLREALTRLDLQCVPKLSGGKGLHVNVPLSGKTTYAATRLFAQSIAELLARTHPDRIVSAMPKRARKGRVFIDWEQNRDYKTTVAAYSLRAMFEEPTVSMPLTWREVATLAKRDRELRVSPGEAVKRVQRHGDVYALHKKQQLPAEFRHAIEAKSKPDESATVIAGVRLPKAHTQSGRRLFVVPETKSAGQELWLDEGGMFHRFILRPNDVDPQALIAMPAGTFKVANEFYRGELPPIERGRTKILDIGAYEIVSGSFATKNLDLAFSGETLHGRWTLAKHSGPQHRSWDFRASPA